MIKLKFLNNLLLKISRIGADGADSDDVLLQKTTLVTTVIMIDLAAILWGLIYIALREPLASSIPLFYSAVSLLGIIIFSITRHFNFFRLSQLILILLLPFLLMLALGGFVNSSAVILWSLFCPLLALLLSQPRSALRWFLAYLGLVVVSSLIQPSLGMTNNLPRIAILGFFVLNIIGVSTIAFTLLYYFVGQKNGALGLLRREQEKSESLLLNVLPKEIAAVLKDENRTIADDYESVSILFADIVGFTPLSAEVSAVEMVDLLNKIFSYFDSLVDKHGVEKIRTIGDNYMVVSGAPRRRPDHAQALAHLALEMCDYVEKPSFPSLSKLKFRIGINSGPVVAGVIGRKKFHYDVWGDAVNIASRMESHGIPGKIQIGRTTYELVKDEFVCVPRGVIEVKGKGEMETWYLEDIRQATLRPI